MPGVLLLSQTTRAQQGTSNLELDGTSSEPRPGKKKRKRSFCSSARLKSGCQEPHPSSPPLDIEVGTFSRCPDTFCDEKSYTERSGCSWALVAFSLPAALNKNVFFNTKRARTHQDGNDLCHHRIQEDSLWVEGGFWKQIMTGGWQGRSEGGRGRFQVHPEHRLCWRLKRPCFTFPPSPPSWESSWVCQQLGKHSGQCSGTLLRSH